MLSLDEIRSPIVMDTNFWIKIHFIFILFFKIYTSKKQINSNDEIQFKTL